MAVLDAAQVVESKRLRLSHLDALHVDAMASWLSAALSPEWRLDDLQRRVDAGHGVLISDHGGKAIGVAVALIDVPSERAASVPFVAIDPARRFRGLGGEAGLTLEKHLRAQHKIESVYAPVPDGRGLAVYFWLRLGYRPLSAEAAPGPLAGLSDESPAGIWMLREAS